MRHGHGSRSSASDSRLEHDRPMTAWCSAGKRGMTTLPAFAPSFRSFGEGGRISAATDTTERPWTTTAAASVVRRPIASSPPTRAILADRPQSLCSLMMQIPVLLLQGMEVGLAASLGNLPSCGPPVSPFELPTPVNGLPIAVFCFRGGRQRNNAARQTSAQVCPTSRPTSSSHAPRLVSPCPPFRSAISLCPLRWQLSSKPRFCWRGRVVSRRAHTAPTCRHVGESALLLPLMHTPFWRIFPRG